jgi:hypothetical protein
LAIFFSGPFERFGQKFGQLAETPPGSVASAKSYMSIWASKKKNPTVTGIL